MSDSLPLPPRPSVEQYKKLAREFQQACKSGDPRAIRAWALRWAESLIRLQDLERTPAVEGQIREYADRIQRRWRDLTKDGERAERCTLADAQLLVARSNGFASWPKFAAHLEDLSRASSPASQFEAAADAIIAGDATTLADLLRKHPGLVRERSSREHRSTLLHYVSANGIEGFRQKTPANIVDIARQLLDAGADVNAESDAYGGRSTTLGLAATSCHPAKAGVQLALLQLLLDRGAIVDRPDGGSSVNDCLHNGRGQAAAFLAGKGARLDLEGAAGVGRLDLIQGFFDHEGAWKPPATPKQLRDAFAWACQFGHTIIVDFLLEHGVDLHASLAHHGQTGLHWAAYGGHADTVRLLLNRGAQVDTADEVFGGTPLAWALYAWGTGEIVEGKSHHETVALLVHAGAAFDEQWYEANDDGRRILARVRADPGMHAALRGEITP